MTTSDAYRELMGVPVEDDKEAAQLDIERAQLKSLLDSPDGRAVLWRVLSKCGIYRTTYQADSGAQGFLEGRRSIGLDLLGDIHDADPNAYITIQQEELRKQLEAQEKREKGK